LDESSLASLLVVIALIPVHALFTLAISAMMNSRAEYAEEQQEMGNRRLQITEQLVSILLLLVMVAISVERLILPLTAQWANLSLAYVIILAPLGLAVLILGKLVPETVGASYADRIAPLLRLLVIPVVFVLRPLTWLVYYLSMMVARLFGSIDTPTSITEAELLTLIDAGQDFEEEERKMIHSVLELGETTVTEIMVPRIDMVAVAKDTSIAQARTVFLESGHSRLPVYEENVDRIIGLVYVKDLLEVWHNGDTVVESVAEIMRPAHFIPETMTADQLLQEFQRKKIHMAIVMEEYGGTGGLVTLENLLEEIVGDIQDEYDEDEPEDIVQVAPNEYRVDAGVVLDDLNDALETKLNDDDIDTLGGFIFNYLERVPTQGEVIITDGLEMRVEKVEGRRIREVYVIKRNCADTDTKDEDEDDTTCDENMSSTTSAHIA
jgi:putative hemolysin